MDEIAKKLGFDNETEMHKMISDIDLSTPDKIQEFKKWQDQDGTKNGLDKLGKIKT